MARTHTQTVTIRGITYGDKGIHQLAGLNECEVEKLRNALRTGPKDRASRSLARECRLWFKRSNKTAPKAGITADKISSQDGLTTERMIVAVV